MKRKVPRIPPREISRRPIRRVEVTVRLGESVGVAAYLSEGHLWWHKCGEHQVDRSGRVRVAA